MSVRFFFSSSLCLNYHGTRNHLACGFTVPFVSSLALFISFLFYSSSLSISSYFSSLSNNSTHEYSELERGFSVFFFFLSPNHQLFGEAYSQSVSLPACLSILSPCTRIFMTHIRARQVMTGSERHTSLELRVIFCSFIISKLLPSSLLARFFYCYHDPLL